MSLTVTPSNRGTPHTPSHPPTCTCQSKIIAARSTRWFRSTALWVMGPARYSEYTTALWCCHMFLLRSRNGHDRNKTILGIRGVSGLTGEGVMWASYCGGQRRTTSSKGLGSRWTRAFCYPARDKKETYMSAESLHFLHMAAADRRRAIKPLVETQGQGSFGLFSVSVAPASFSAFHWQIPVRQHSAMVGLRFRCRFC